MAKIYKHTPLKNAGRYLVYGLAFFLTGLATACKHHTNKITLVWKDDKAVGIAIPEGKVRDASKLHARHSMRVVLSGTKGQGILGSFEMTDDAVQFNPLIPLSPGMSYDIWQDDHLIGSIKVPQAKGDASRLLSIYPQQDTLPENQLKIYLHFSKPMRTGRSLDHIYLLDAKRDTMQRVFLDLQPELWDTTGTVLTLWLDPGRIKRDLVLNRKLGNPLKRSQHYQLVIANDWKDSQGMLLKQVYTKNFVAGERDGSIPDIDQWQLNIPKSGTSNPVSINTSEPLDHYLLQESISIWVNDTAVKGKVGVSGKDKIWTFTPASPWQAGRYHLRVNARLEDLAGNNLNRVFDRDTRKDKQQNKVYFERGFDIR